MPRRIFNDHPCPKGGHSRYNINMYKTPPIRCWRQPAVRFAAFACATLGFPKRPFHPRVVVGMVAAVLAAACLSAAGAPGASANSAGAGCCHPEAHAAAASAVEHPRDHEPSDRDPARHHLPNPETFAIADHVVLSEIYYDSPGTDTDCFVELYNPTDAAVALAGWSLVGLNGNGNSEYGIIPLSGSIASHGFFLVGQDGSVLGVVPDIVDGNANYQNGSDGLKLKGPGGVLVDYIGYGNDPDINLEGQAYIDVNPGQSIERKSGPVHNEAEGNGWDTDSNIDDCRTRGTPEPQSTASPPEDPPPPSDTNPPTFAGVESVTDAGLGGSLLLAWSPATDPEGSTPILYRVYRATTSGGQNFGAPADSTHRADGFADNFLQNGTTYYYVVRAVDAFGNEEGNTVEMSGTPSGSPPNLTAFYGTLHAHTALSDGQGTPSDAFSYARGVALIDVLALSEHSHQLTAAEYASLHTQADAFNVDGDFVAIAAQEAGVLSEYGHLNVYDAPIVVPAASGDLAGTYDFIEAGGYAASFCHPADWNGSNFNSFAYDGGADQTLGGLAVISGSGPPYEGAYHQALDIGWKVGAVGDQDVHDTQWGDWSNPSGDILLTGFPIDALTRDGVLDAVRGRNTYAFETNPMDDRIALEFMVEGQPMGSELTVGMTVHFSVQAVGESPIERIDLIRDGGIAAAWADGTLAAVWNPTDAPAVGDHYYYVRLEQADGDRLWSSPVWVTVTGQTAVAAGAPSVSGLRIATAPNPMRSWAWVELASGSRDPLTLRVADVSGRHVRQLYAGPGGEVGVRWDGTNDRGRAMAAGVYFVIAEQAGERQVRKLLVAR